MIVTEVNAALSADVVIIGSGPGGSVVAATLAAAGRDVLLLEEGPYLEQDLAAPFSYAEMKQKYRGAGITIAFGKPDIAYAEGRCVGGGSEVNSGLYHRLPEDIRAAWQTDHRLHGFSASELEHYFTECEQVLVPATYPNAVPVASQILRDGAEKLQWRSEDIPRLVKFGADKDTQGVEASSRNSMTRSFIPTFLESGGRLLPDVRVGKIKQLPDSTWQIDGVWKSRQSIAIKAQSLFIACGAVQTPALLKRSGIRRNVGNSLSLQPMLKVTAEFPRHVNYPDMGIAAEQIKEFAPGYSFGCSISTPAHVAINLLRYPDGTKTTLERHANLVSYYVMAQGSSSGSVVPLPGFRHPLVRYRISALEMSRLASGVRDLTRLLLAAGATQVFTGVSEQPIVSEAAGLAQMPGVLQQDSANIMTVHLIGSCPMGEDKDRAAVDSFGRVHDVANLYVADSSIFCESPAVNPQGTIMALAKRNAEHFLSEQK